MGLATYALRNWIQGVASAHGLGWDDLNSAWADGNLAEAAVQLGKGVEHRNQSQPNPGLRADLSPCT